MGMFDSLYVKCPKCGKELEFQSKSGECSLSVYNKYDLLPTVAIGMNEDIVKCDYCKNNWKFTCNIPEVVKVKLIKTKQKAYYKGNYNNSPTKNKEKKNDK